MVIDYRQVARKAAFNLDLYGGLSLRVVQDLIQQQVKTLRTKVLPQLEKNIRQEGPPREIYCKQAAVTNWFATELDALISHPDFSDVNRCKRRYANLQARYDVQDVALTQELLSVQGIIPEPEKKEGQASGSSENAKSSS